MKEELKITTSGQNNAEQLALVQSEIIPVLLDKFGIKLPNKESEFVPEFAYSTTESFEGSKFEPIEISWGDSSVQIDAQMLQTVANVGSTAHLLVVQLYPDTFSLFAGVYIPSEENQNHDDLTNWTDIGFIKSDELTGQIVFYRSNSILAAESAPSVLPEHAQGSIQIHLFEDIHKTQVEPLNFFTSENPR